MLVLINRNGALVQDGKLRVDRKFLTGMKYYAEKLNVPIITVNPEMSLSDKTMDVVEAPCDDLPFTPIIIKDNGRSPESQSQLTELIRQSRLIYGDAFGASRIAKSLGIPYVLVLEYDLLTQIRVTTLQVENPLRKCVRAIKLIANYALHQIPSMLGARSIHCNGYPVYDESGSYNSNRLLYLDSRMSLDQVIGQKQLESRITSRRGRAIRLLFSGRYERMKGSDDSVRVAIECLRRGMNIEMHCYGQGPLRGVMLDLASQSSAASRIQVFDAIPYPELVEKSREYDVFVCCHIQSDPSCTYLESFGAGLPIVGFSNRMWLRMNEISRVGYSSPMGNIAAVADSIQQLIDNPDTLDEMSWRARDFALAHCFENEFTLRTNAILQELDGSGGGRPPFNS